MKAAVLTSYGDANKAFTFKEVKNPVIEKNEVLIKVEVFGLNFADVMARRGLYADAPNLPAILGYDVVGIVVDSKCDKGKELIGKKVVAMTRFGGYAEYVKTNIDGLAILSEDIDSNKATALATQYSTAYYSAIECANLFEGSKILIHACAGGVGTAITQIAKYKKCEVIGLASNEEKCDYLKSIGVDYPIDTSKGDYIKQIKSIKKDYKIDASFNAVGGLTFKKDLKILNNGGKLILYGVSSRMKNKKGIFGTIRLLWNFGLMTPVELLISSKSIMGVNMLRIADNKPEILQRCLKNVVALTKKGILNLVVGKVFSIDDIDMAHEYLESRKSIGKIVVKI